MSALLWIIAIWMGFNLALPAFIYWQKSPHFRVRVRHLTIEALSQPRERDLVHGLVQASRRQERRGYVRRAL